MEIAFIKMSGAGNDFILIDNRDGKINNGSALAKKICDRHWGVGADGLILLESSNRVVYKMNYYNSDGSYGGMCGNGGRCVALLAYHWNIAGRKHDFEALDHIYSATIDSNEVSIRMKNPTHLMMNRYLYVGKKKIKYHSINTGSPHIILEVNQWGKGSSLKKFDIYYWGNLLRWHKRFSPKGTNVNFIEKTNTGDVQLRTFERGVEAETLACGTGSIAAAIIAHKFWKLKPPITVLPTSNIPLKVDFKINGKVIQDVELKGSTTIVFTGRIDV